MSREHEPTFTRTDAGYAVACACGWSEAIRRGKAEAVHTHAVHERAAVRARYQPAVESAGEFTRATVRDRDTGEVVASCDHRHQHTGAGAIECAQRLRRQFMRSKRGLA